MDCASFLFFDTAACDAMGLSSLDPESAAAAAATAVVPVSIWNQPARVKQALEGKVTTAQQAIIQEAQEQQAWDKSSQALTVMVGCSACAHTLLAGQPLRKV
jgi:hypothetical protein